MKLNKIGKSCAAILLAAGKGTRMHSSKPKVLQKLLGEPMLGWVLSACEPIFSENIYIVAGHGADELEQTFPGKRFVIQNQQLGTGHALRTALSAFPEPLPEYVAVINGDAPLITAEVIKMFLDSAWGSDLAFATLILENPGAYGRVVRDNGNILAIIEAKDFDPDLHGPVTGEVNAGIYLIKTCYAQQFLPLIQDKNNSKEFYLTDIISIAAKNHLNIKGIQCGKDESLLGVNTPGELAHAENKLALRISDSLLEKGVLIHAPQFLRCGPHVKIAPGAEIIAPCELYGNTEIASGAAIESHCVINNTKIAENAVIHSFSHLDNADVGKSAQVGPYTRLRPKARMEENTHVGNFVELKNTLLGKGAKANHLSYLGDSDIGANTNIGAGTITCNYDGKKKHKTTIGENAFIGSNTALVAPVSVGAGALIGAGSTITKDVPEDTLGIARSKQKNLPLHNVPQEINNR